MEEKLNLIKMQLDKIEKMVNDVNIKSDRAILLGKTALKKIGGDDDER